MPPNGPVHIVCEILHSVMPSATEVEIGALFTNMRIGEELRLALEEMGHPQPPTLVMTDNSTVYGILNKTVKQKEPGQLRLGSIGCATNVHRTTLLSIGDPGLKI
eukprot:15355335-Ditylum_brightwellii.AAC.1